MMDRADGMGWYVIEETAAVPAADGLPARRGVLLYADAAAAKAHEVEGGWARTGTTFYAANVGGALRNATLVPHIGRVRPEDAGSIPAPEHVEVACADAASERIVRSMVAIAYETPTALGLRSEDMAKLSRAVRAGARVSILLAVVEEPGMWPEEPGDAAYSP